MTLGNASLFEISAHGHAWYNNHAHINTNHAGLLNALASIGLFDTLDNIDLFVTLANVDLFDTLANVLV